MSVAQPAALSTDVSQPRPPGSHCVMLLTFCAMHENQRSLLLDSRNDGSGILEELRRLALVRVLDLVAARGVNDADQTQTEVR